MHKSGNVGYALIWRGDMLESRLRVGWVPPVRWGLERAACSRFALRAAGSQASACGRRGSPNDEPRCGACGSLCVSALELLPMGECWK